MGGGGSSNDNNNTAHTVGRQIWERDDGRRRVEEGHARLTVKAALFYAYKGLVDSIDSGWIQSEFDVLTGIFDRVGLQKNVRKTVGVVCKPFCSARVWVDETYTQWITG